MTTKEYVDFCVTATAANVLMAAPPGATANAFGSLGELEHALRMVGKFPSDEWSRALISALVRVAGQRSIPAAAEVFVWDERSLTNAVNRDALGRMLDALDAEHVKT